MTKIKVIDLDELYNFVVDDFFSWSRSLIKNSIWRSQTLNFKFQIVQIESDGEMTKIKILRLNEFYNFGFGDFSIGNHLLTSTFVRSCQILKIQNLNCSNELICTRDRYNSCISRWVIQFCCLWFLHLKHQKISLKLNLKFS